MAASKKASKKKAKKPAKKVVKKAVKKPKSAKKPVKKVVKKAVKKIAKKAVKKIVKKPAKKPAAKKPAPKKAAVKKPSPIKVPSPSAGAPSSAPSAPRPAVQASPATPEKAEIVEIGTNSFVIVVNRARNFFDREEMRLLLGICQAAGSEDDAAARLYYWLKEHRKDVLMDSSITTIYDKALKMMYRALISTYSLKGSQ